MSLYVNAGEGGPHLGQVYGPRLGRIRTGSASVSFASASDIDLAVLDEMVRHACRLMDWT